MYVIEVFVDNEGQEGAQVTFLTEKSNERIAISLFQSNTTETQVTENTHGIDRTIELLAQSVTTEDDDEAETLQDEALDVIYGAAGHLDPHSETTEEPTQAPKELNLHNLLFPKTSFYRLEEVAGELAVVPIPPDEAYGPTYGEDQDQDVLGSGDEMYIDVSLPSYTPEKVKVVEQLVHGGGGTVCLALVDGRQVFCKARHDGLRNDNLRREMDCLHKIQQAGSTVRVPKLLGYVRHPKSGAVLGFLREWIPSARPSLKSFKQEDSDGGVGFTEAKAPREMRKKWARQIQKTVEALHAIGVVWGDAKPGNVVVDLDGDAWLVDFGGGWSAGWVDERVQHTVAGDLQGVERILKFLEVDV